MFRIDKTPTIILKSTTKSKARQKRTNMLDCLLVCLLLFFPCCCRGPSTLCDVSATYVSTSATLLMSVVSRGPCFSFLFEVSDWILR